MMELQNDLIQLALGLAQAVALLLCAPLVTGIIKKTKALLQNRIGSSVWQEYYDIRKWWGKDTMLTPYTGIIFKLSPCVYFITTLAAACMLPSFIGGKVSFGDVFVFVYLLALGRFFMAVSSMDAATAFGGMGGSREVYVAAFVEPVVMLAILSNVLHTGSTSLAGMSLRPDEVNLTVAGVLTCIAFFLMLLAENSRIPVDNPDTHLELTMIHECMTLEYSGRLLALIHWASQLKILIFLVLFAMLYLPLDLPVILKVLLGAVAVGVVETLNNKMRLFKVRVYLAAAGLMLLLAVVAQ
ncbi:respiratory chain complex I subunit 1 family protein [uncultured Phascolarctobacterium sp.]|uniref:respiratory chain complex I subunit 1 family protein n=1 Tax=uncultured Phascolarctobacterium sp. TaxID=512296 RepID=UPI002617D0CC|nr:NADH-quinone oxidoreductase subunit H [uncultured Phascolarctobacterium sp.]